MEGLMKEGSLGSILFKSQIITEGDIAAALERQKAAGCRFGEALVDLGIVTQEDIDWALANQLDIPYVRLKEEMIDREAVSLVPVVFARQFNLVPLIRVGEELSIALADPLNRTAIVETERITGCRVTVSVALLREIREMQEIFYGPATATFGFSSDRFPAKTLAAMNADTSGAAFLNYLLLFMVQNRLTSLSCQPLGTTVRLTGRRGGIAREVGCLQATYYPDFVQHVRKTARLNGTVDIAAKGILGYRHKGHNARFQVLLLRGEGSEYVTLKPQPFVPPPASIAGLGLTAEKEAAFHALATVRHGMVVFSSRDQEERCRLIDLFLKESNPSGKTVLLLGDYLGHAKVPFPRISLRHLSPQEKHRLVMAALEHDPDVIALEDATDLQTLAAAATAAARGKLVLAGIAGQDTPDTLEHLLHARHRHYAIPTVVRGVISCAAVATLCSHCKENYSPPADERDLLRLPVDVQVCFRAVGCPACNQSGYQGDRYLLDVIPFDARMVEDFTAAQGGEELARVLEERGLCRAAAEGRELLYAGDISPDEFVASILR